TGSATASGRFETGPVAGHQTQPLAGFTAGGDFAPRPEGAASGAGCHWLAEVSKHAFEYSGPGALEASIRTGARARRRIISLPSVDRRFFLTSNARSNLDPSLRPTQRRMRVPRLRSRGLIRIHSRKSCQFALH